MIRQQFDVENYWKVIVYYNVDYNLFSKIENDFRRVGEDAANTYKIYQMMSSYKAKAVTYSNTFMHISIIIFNKHQSETDYINSIVHEAEHVKQAMLKAYKVEDKGEPPAYTIGYLVSKMWNVLKSVLNITQ